MTITAYDPAEIDRLLPRLPEPARRAAAAMPSAALSDDDQEVLALLLERSPVFAELFQGNTERYRDEHGVVDDNKADWGLIKDLLRATGMDAERTERIARLSDLADTRNGKWDDHRSGENYLRYSINRAIAAWDEDEGVNDAPHRLLAPTSGCDGHCEYRRQVDAIVALVKSDLPDVFKITLIWLSVLVGFNQARGRQTFTMSAQGAANKIHLSAQTVRTVLHSLARYDNNGKLVRKDGLLDLQSHFYYVKPSGEECTCPCHKRPGSSSCPSCGQEEPRKSFKVTPLTEGRYTGFLTAAAAFTPVLPVKEKKARKPAPAEPVPLPAEVVDLECPGPGSEHPTVYREVVCRDCGDQLIEERIYRLQRVNDAEYRSAQPPPPWLRIGDIPHRLEQPLAHQALPAGADLPW